ncbi:hypothetical protein ACFXGT_35545 [Streptomyces sp. NPDC059352]|uniref:hypothetical protein n=1 Tax=Streptomyces sp. NPDC059352 TaxID=3346810 RepID=UPI0036BB32EE
MRTRRAVRGTRAGGALAHLLLVVVLALGVFLMHAVGHPQGSGGTTTGTASATATATGHTATGAHSNAPQGSPGAQGSSDAHGSHSSADTDGSDARHDPGAGMDMTTLCVAVLGAWLLAGLVRAALTRRPDWLAVLLARLVPALGPHAPPRRPPDLTLLSVLRI